MFVGPALLNRGVSAVGEVKVVRGDGGEVKVVNEGKVVNEVNALPPPPVWALHATLSGYRYVRYTDALPEV